MTRFLRIAMVLAAASITTVLVFTIALREPLGEVVAETSEFFALALVGAGIMLRRANRR